VLVNFFFVGTGLNSVNADAADAAMAPSASTATSAKDALLNMDLICYVSFRITGYPGAKHTTASGHQFLFERRT
jgi:hypothetical protein